MVFWADVNLHLCLPISQWLCLPARGNIALGRYKCCCKLLCPLEYVSTSVRFWVASSDALRKNKFSILYLIRTAFFNVALKHNRFLSFLLNWWKRRLNLSGNKSAFWRWITCLNLCLTTLLVPACGYAAFQTHQRQSLLSDRAHGGWWAFKMSLGRNLVSVGTLPWMTLCTWVKCFSVD